MTGWIVFNIGCIECGVSSNIVGIYATKEEAEKVVQSCKSTLKWREGGENHFQAFDLSAPCADEYKNL